MQRYLKYLMSHLMWPTILVTASLTGIIWLTQMLRFVDFMLNRGLSLSDFLYLTGLMLPSLLLILIPIALTIAVIYTYNKLTGDSELIVFNAVGISKMQLALPAVLVGGICAIICVILSFYLMPVATQQFRDIRTFFRDKYASVLLEEEVFNTPMDGLTVFVRKRDRQNNLYGILLHDNRVYEKPVSMMAAEGKLVQTPSGPRFNLTNGLRQEVRNGKVNWLSFDNYALDIAFYGQDIQRKREPDERTIGELFDYKDVAEADVPKLRAEGHQRILWPFFNLALPLLVLAIIFSGEFNRRGQWKRMTISAVSAAVTVLIFFALRNLVVKQPMLIPLMYLLLIGVSAWSVATLMSGRTIRWRNPLKLREAN
ncbi:MAG: LptF/LptG family permease [Rickettsiales bacterium]